MRHSRPAVINQARNRASEILVIGGVVRPLPVKSSKYLVISITGRVAGRMQQGRKCACASDRARGTHPSLADGSAVDDGVCARRRRLRRGGTRARNGR